MSRTDRAALNARIRAAEAAGIKRAGWDDQEEPSAPPPLRVGRYRYLYLRLKEPMMSFGAAQANSVYRDDDIVTQRSGIPPGNAVLPGRSFLTGLIGNALGYERYDSALLTQLHDSIRFAAALVQRGKLEEEFASAAIGINDRGWTTRGRVEGRRGGPDTYAGSHVMRHGYWAGADVAIALRLRDDSLTDQVAAALIRPERPLFVGRKAQPPSTYLYRGMLRADDAHSALRLAAFDAEPVIWDRGEGPADAPIITRDDRDWVSGVFAGSYEMHLRDQTPDIDPAADPAGYAQAMLASVKEDEL